jgi:hypothetical protein
MYELFPIAGGLLLGAVLSLIRPGMRLAAGAVASVALGALATVISGECRMGWEFVLIDIPLVAVSSLTGFATVRAVRRRVASVHAG